MKRLLILLCALLMVFTSAFCLTGCDFVKDFISTITNAETDGEEDGNTIAVHGSIELEQALNTLDEDKKILLCDGMYNKKLVIHPKSFPVHIVGEDSVSLNGVTIYDGVKDFTIEKVNFALKGIELGRAENVNIKNCGFSLNANIINLSGCTVTNLVIDGCFFVNISNSLTSAMKIQDYDGLTVKNCTFENVEYNAMQLGNNFAGGVVVIENNTFKDIGSRVIYLVYIENLVSCTIENNTFYDNIDSLLLPGATDDGIKKENGLYIHSKSTTGNLLVGKNFWEEIPDYDAIYIAPVADYDIIEQELIKDQKV